MANSRNFLRWRIGLTAAALAVFGATYAGISANDPGPTLEDMAMLDPQAQTPAPTAISPGATATPEVRSPQGQKVRIVVVPKPKARTRAS